MYLHTTEPQDTFQIQTSQGEVVSLTLAMDGVRAQTRQAVTLVWNKVRQGRIPLYKPVILYYIIVISWYFWMFLGTLIWAKKNSK